MKFGVLVASVSMLLSTAAPALAAEGLPGATVRAEPGKAAAERRARMEERCRAEPEKCRAERQARFEQWCKDNAERCRELKARREQCRADPGKCRAEREARFNERFRQADANGDGALTRAEAEQGMRFLARRFDAIDANKDGVVTREEIAAARKARAGQRSQRI